MLAHLAASVSRVLAQPGAVRFLPLCGKLAIRLVSITGRKPETGIKKLPPLANLCVPVYRKTKQKRQRTGRGRERREMGRDRGEERGKRRKMIWEVKGEKWERWGKTVEQCRDSKETV